MPNANMRTTWLKILITLHPKVAMNVTDAIYKHAFEINQQNLNEEGFFEIVS